MMICLRHVWKNKKISEPTENEQLSLGEILSLEFLKENISELELLKLKYMSQVN